MSAIWKGFVNRRPPLKSVSMHLNFHKLVGIALVDINVFLEVFLLGLKLGVV